MTTLDERPSTATASAVPERTTLTMAGAINAGLRAAMERDDKVLLMGEDIGALGGVFRVTDGLHKDFGDERVMDTPLAESGIVGTAIGMAMRGYRPVIEIQFDGFIFPAYDQITTQLAKMHYRSGGLIQLPVVIRVPYAGGIGAIEHHSESPEALFAHTPGLRIISPATPQDGFDMIQQAIASPDPVLFFEPKARYWDKGEVERGRVKAQARRRRRCLRRYGRDVARPGGPRGSRRHARRVRPHRAPRAPGRRGGGGRWHRCGGHRPAVDLPARFRCRGSLGPAHRTGGGGPRGAHVVWCGRRA
ncbi:hypothetical protein GCM10025876_20570 [Demequina litorisediminis]|uniref:Transketolase-like pyrimidine-binding domain-containing protein n=1 Tax=Demequina litorisediminis TaxID=1849022 RepID=A0ABQ6IGJ8_9MICO|nr:hypothetical protein GCM10025876_20570 [Demequina litorisediminis]